MRVLFDANVVLDLLLDRDPFSEDAAGCLSMAESGEIEGWLCASTITTLRYLIGKSAGARNALDAVSVLLSFCEIAPVNKTVLESALRLPFKHFEDAVLHEAARCSGVEVIVTRNIADFKHSTVSVQLPETLLQN